MKNRSLVPEEYEETLVSIKASVNEDNNNMW